MVMREFRKKPVVVQAVQVTMSQGFYDILESLCPSCEVRVMDEYEDEIYPEDDEDWSWEDAEYIMLCTEDEDINLKFYEGDWLVKGVDGSVYPVKNETFEKVYEAVDSKAVITW